MQLSGVGLYWLIVGLIVGHTVLQMVTGSTSNFSLYFLVHCMKGSSITPFGCTHYFGPALSSVCMFHCGFPLPPPAGMRAAMHVC